MLDFVQAEHSQNIRTSRGADANSDLCLLTAIVKVKQLR